MLSATQMREEDLKSYYDSRELLADIGKKLEHALRSDNGREIQVVVLNSMNGGEKHAVFELLKEYGYEIMYDTNEHTLRIWW